ncbi:MAG: MoaD/ThiS family protein [Deltaproteobacteria bacterium]|nr:MoaD/ThiS family protein [Deltaproteobacteria bacterium]
MRVAIPSPLRSYTAQKSEVEASGASLAELLADLDRQYPGIRFRMIDEQDRLRPHMRLFVNKVETRALATALTSGDEVHIFQALSGG